MDAEAEVARAREFASNAAHQIRTPMSALRLRLDDLTLWSDVPDEVRVELLECIAEVDRLNGTLQDLLSMSRGEAALSASVSSVDLADAAASSVGRWRRLFQGQDRAVVFSAPPDSILVHTAPRALLQVLDVLLENALVHGAGEVRVEVKGEERRGVIAVSDDGSISDMAAERVFDRSYRSATSAGSGIGLALARTIVDSNGGRLRVSQFTPTCFELSFARST